MTGTTSPRQRAVDAMYGQPIDRPTCVPLIDTSYSSAVLGVPISECFLNPRRHAESLMACLDRHPLIDGLSENFTLAEEAIISREKTASGWLVESTGGMTWTIPYNDIGSVTACDITSFDDSRLESDNPFKAGP